jgi:hypothetical protein
LLKYKVTHHGRLSAGLAGEKTSWELQKIATGKGKGEKNAMKKSTYLLALSSKLPIRWSSQPACRGDSFYDPVPAPGKQAAGF